MVNMEYLGFAELPHSCPDQNSFNGEHAPPLPSTETPHATTQQNEVAILLQSIRAQHLQLFEAQFTKLEERIVTMLSAQHGFSQLEGSGPEHCTKSLEACHTKLHQSNCSIPKVDSEFTSVENAAAAIEVPKRPSAVQVYEREDGRKCRVKKKKSKAKGLNGEKASFSYEGQSVRMWTEELLQNIYFESAIQLVIMANTVYMAWHTDRVAQTLAEPNDLANRITELFFTSVFCVDIALRLYVEQRQFVSGKNWRWNLLDSMVVITALLEEAMFLVMATNSSAMSSAKIMRVIRVLRLVRILRFVRGASFFTELRALCLGIFLTMGSLVWALLLLVLVIFVFSIYLTQGVAYYLMDQVQVGAIDVADHDLRTSYGSLLLTMYSLWKAVTGGADWETFCDPLFEIDWITGLIFIFFIAFVVCAVMNVVTGIFVDKALKATEGDMDLLLAANSKDKKDRATAVRKVFESADTDGSGQLSKEEFAEHFNDPSVQMFFKGLDLDLESFHPDQLFDLLDFDGDHTVDVNEFLHGCCTMKGYARNLDLARLTHNFNRFEEELSSLTKRVLTSMTSSAKHQAEDLQTMKKTLATIAVSSRRTDAVQCAPARDAAADVAHRALPEDVADRALAKVLKDDADCARDWEDNSWHCYDSPRSVLTITKNVEDKRTVDADQLLQNPPHLVGIEVFFGEEVKNLGFKVEWRVPMPVVASVDQNGEAEACGIRSGDFIEVVNDHRTEGLFREDLLPHFKIRPLTLQFGRLSHQNNAAEL